MPPFQVYLLDYDGTMADSRPAGVACLTHTLLERGAAAPADQIQAVIAAGVTLETALATLLPDLGEDEISAHADLYRALYTDYDRRMTSLFAGVRETVARLREDGRAVVVLSNKGRAALDDALTRFDLAALASAVVGSDPGAPVKPDPAVFTQRVRPLFAGLSLSDFLMVGDTAADIAFARAVGIASCWTRYGYGDVDHCLALKPDFVADALPDLLQPAAGPA